MPNTYTSIHATGSPIEFKPIVVHPNTGPFLCVWIGGVSGPASLHLNESNAEALISAIRTGLVDLANAIAQP